MDARSLKVKRTMANKSEWIGEGVYIHPSAEIRCETCVIGRYAYIGPDVRIFCNEFRLGDFSKLNAGAYANGKNDLQIGRNCWFGGNVVLDAQGGLFIDDNVTCGAQTQIWTHFQAGDFVEGAPDISRRSLVIGKDAWIGSNCVVSVPIPERAMLLPGSNAYKKIEWNQIHGGNPAVSLGKPHFANLTPAQKAQRLQLLIDEFEDRYPAHSDQLTIATCPDQREGNWFDVSTRTYAGLGHPAEIMFLKMMVPRIRMVPESVPPFIELPGAKFQELQEI